MVRRSFSNFTSTSPRPRRWNNGRLPLAGGRPGRSAVVTTELVVAMAILGLVLLPMAFTFRQESKLCRSYYQRAVAMELIDGEMEILVAGHWRAFAPGTQPYRMTGRAATNLPPGRFLLSLKQPNLRLEWQPTQKGQGGLVAREARIP